MASNPKRRVMVVSDSYGPYGPYDANGGKLDADSIASTVQTICKAGEAPRIVELDDTREVDSYRDSLDKLAKVHAAALVLIERVAGLGQTESDDAPIDLRKAARAFLKDGRS